ncbi:hypothetical protein EXN66_Car022532 [Channa argus]|nr:hypothetical protein EXN66_Car022532 [Channa argus]
MYKERTQQLPLEQAIGNSGEEKLPLTEETSSRTRLRVDGHLPRPVGVSGKGREKRTEQQKQQQNIWQIGRTSSCTLEDTQLQSQGTPGERDRERGTEEDKDNYGREHTELMTYSDPDHYIFPSGPSSHHLPTLFSNHSSSLHLKIYLHGQDHTPLFPIRPLLLLQTPLVVSWWKRCCTQHVVACFWSP